MDEHFRHMQQEASEVAQEWRRQSHDREMRVATWVLVGNGAALLLCFNAAIARQICDWSVLQPYAGVFLLGIVCVVASVIFAGEVVNRATTRLTLISSQAKQASICIDANGRFYAAKRMGAVDAAVDDQIRSNEETISRALNIVSTQTGEPKIEKLLHLASRLTLAAGAACFGGALLVAVNSDVLRATLC